MSINLSTRIKTTIIFVAVGKFEKQAGAGRPRNNVQVEEVVLARVDADPSLSTRAIANQEGLSQSTVWRILKNYLLHPYHIQRVQALEEGDFFPRQQFCNWLEVKCAEVNHFETLILFTDEAGFTRNGIFNFHNNHMWADENPHTFVQRSHQRQFTLNVWGGIIGNYVLGPIFLPQPLNGINYTEFLQNELPNLCEDLPLDIRRDMWFMHDGAPPHFSLIARQQLNNIFENRWIGRGGPITWPARSPDLNPLDYYLWGHLKQLVYQVPINNIDVLRQRIIDGFEIIRTSPRLLTRVRQNFIRRIHACQEANGHHFEHFL